ncbi:MAG TPA: hypothetical protein VJW76_07535 [Verrucomicrobiae bacterium]|nr:hypothetical protein [Verrucomicrobiae bacterium]
MKSLSGIAWFSLAFAAVNFAATPDGSEHRRDSSWVERRIQELQPTASDRRFDEIGWAQDIRTSLRLARQHNRPVFLFTHDGRINTGRC